MKFEQTIVFIVAFDVVINFFILLFRSFMHISEQFSCDSNFMSKLASLKPSDELIDEAALNDVELL